MAQGATTQKFTTTQHEKDEAPKIVWHKVLPHKNHYHTSCVVMEGVNVVMLAHFRLSVPHNVPHFILPHFATETL